MSLFKDQYGELKPTPITFNIIFGFVLLVLIITMSPFSIVGAGHRGVIINFGKVSDTVLGEGFHLVSPFADIEEIEVRTQRYDSDADSASKDLQTVSTKLAVNYELIPNKVNALYQELSDEHEKRVIAPAIQEATKSATAQFTAEELIVKREEVKTKIIAGLKSRLDKYYINVVDVNIVNFGFSEDFNRAIEAKQTAKQDALRAEANLQKVKAEAEQRVAQAQAEAEAIRLQSSAASSQNYVQLKALEVQEKAISKWNGQLPTHFVPDSSIPFLNLQK